MMKNTLLVFALLMISLFSNGQIIDFVDPKFKQVITNWNCVDTNSDGQGDIKVDQNNDGQLEKSEILQVTSLIISGNDIQDIKGIEEFENLIYFKIYGNNIDSVNLNGLINLESLICNNNKINYLNINQLSSLKYLDCSKNNIEFLDLEVLKNLEVLNCTLNKLSYLKLISLSNLVKLYCGNNQLLNLDLNNLKKIEEIYCEKNQITTLILSNENKIKKLYCHRNMLNSIDLSNLSSLELSRCDSNNIKSIDLNNLKKLRYIDLRANQILKLEIQKLDSLLTLVCSNNNMSSLKIENCKSLSFISCSNNKLKVLDFQSLISLDDLYCSNNELSALFIKNGIKLASLIFQNNPDLKYICCNDFDINFIRNEANKYGSINFEINSYCTFTPGGNFFSILGKVINDEDVNGCDNNDIYIPNLKFNISSISSSGTLVSDYNGSYFIPVQEGTHTIKPILENPEYFNISPDSITVTFPSTSDTIIQDFCISPIGIFKQVDLSIIPLTPPAIPGFNTSYKVVMTNKGNQIENGTLYFAYDEAKMDFIFTEVNPSTQTDGLLSWNFTDLLPFETRYYNVTLNVNSPSETPPVNAGDELLITCNILDNVFLLKQEVVGSHDPNDKTCLEGKTITPEQVGDYVHYLIRFENTGNYAAENVVVKDVIDASTFDISTLQITDASHEAWARINGNVVEFIFENIQLPFDDVSNDGYICFKLKTKPTLVLGNELNNEANIYFDYNLPILTNKTNTIVAIPVGTDEAIGGSDIEIFPNPVSDVLKFTGEDKILKVEIFDMSGRLAQVSSVVNGEVDIQKLSKGIYNIGMKSDMGKRVKRFIKM